MQRRRISSYISALAISMLFVASPAHAQSKAKKMVEQPDTVPLFRGLAVSVDAIGLG